MIYRLVSIRDRAADVFSVPQFVVNTGSAIRSFGDLVNNNNAENQVAQHPEDFDLYYLGEYDDSNGSFVVESPRQIAVGKDLKR